MTFLLRSNHAMQFYVCNWCVFVTKISSEMPVFNIWHQSAWQSVPPWARIWGSAVIFRRGSASKHVWETVAWRISENYYEITIERKFVLKSNWVSTDVLQQSPEETLNRCCQPYFLTYRYNNTKHVRRPLCTKVFSQPHNTFRITINRMKKQE